METAVKNKLILFSVLGVVAVILFLIFSPFVIIESGTVGIISTLGKYNNEELQPGFHLKMPLIQSVKNFDVKVRTIHYKGYEDLPDEQGVIKKPSITVLDKRGLPVDIELTAQYRVIPDQAAELLQEWGTNWEEKMVNPSIRYVVRNVVGKYPAEKLPVRRQEIGVKIQEGIKKSIWETSQKKVDVIGVQLRNIQLPKDISEKIEEVQSAKQDAEKMKYVEEKAKREQEVKKIKAETEKIEKVIRAEAEAEKKIKEAEGVAKAKLLEAEATAKANRMISKSIDKNVLKWRELDIQQQLADSLKSNPNATIFLNTPQGNMHYWLDKK